MIDQGHMHRTLEYRSTYVQVEFLYVDIYNRKQSANIYKVAKLFDYDFKIFILFNAIDE